MGLSNKDKDILEYIKRFMMANGYAPSMREIGEGLGLASTASVHSHFDKLAKQGYITMHDKRYSVRGMRYVEVDDESCADMSCV